MKEIGRKRKPNSKVFALGNNQFHYRVSKTPIHYRDHDGNLQDINLTPVLENGVYLVDQCPYTLRVAPSVPIYNYVGPSGIVYVELKTINDNSIGERGCTWEQNRFIWKNLSLDTDYEIQPTAAGVATYLILHSDNAPRKWTWQARGDDILRPIIGIDAKGKRCSLVQTNNDDTISVEWDGTVISKKALRKGKKTEKPTYPVRIDPTVNEAISTDADDGSSFSIPTISFIEQSLTSTNVLLGGVNTSGSEPYYYIPGFRFQSIAIPNGATIDSATLTLDITGVSGSPVLKFYGDDIDNAPGWSTGSRIRDITKTTAAATMSPSTSGTLGISVQAIIQEIINRAGWASGNNLRLAGFDQVGSGSNRFSLADQFHPTAMEAQLDITYTVVGGSPDSQAAILVGI